jgi:transposase
MKQQELIAVEEGEAEKRREALREKREAEANSAPPRVVTASRGQVELQAVDLESLIAAEHRARAVWAVVEGMDLRQFYAQIRARGSRAGRTSTDPKVLLALWLYATAEGVVHARELERLCKEHDAYRWLRGGVPVNYHTLSDFRTGHQEALNELLTQVLGVMMQQGLIRLRRVTQDGTRVRASAGSRSFRRRAKLEECLQAARRHVEALEEEGKKPAGQGGRKTREEAARLRAARQREERIGRALGALKQVQEDRAASKPGNNDPKTPARGSTTDPDARKMRMGDGGYRPAYNAQFATDTEAGVIVGVAVSQNRTDFGEASPMIEQIEERTGRRPEELLVDTGFTSREAVEQISAAGVTLYGALPQRKGKPDPYAPQKRDTVAMQALKMRMSSESGRRIYRERAAVAERVNADLKTWRGLERLAVRGKNKVTCIVLWSALAFNVLRWLSLAPSSNV